MDEQSKTITLRQFENIIDAQVAVDILKQNGLNSFVSNELGAQLYPLFPSSVSGVCLHVFEHDKERAEELLTTFLQEK